MRRIGERAHLVDILCASDYGHRTCERDTTRENIYKSRRRVTSENARLRDSSRNPTPSKNLMEGRLLQKLIRLMLDINRIMHGVITEVFEAYVIRTSV